MEKLKMQTADMAERNIEMLGQMFPNCLTETINADGKLVRAIDFDKLRQELACEVVEGADERYQFTWPDKRNAIRLANAPINKTLRPCREESVDFDNTENLYIEGDNLEVLKLLRENYLGKVKMIYIDPPYNTGNDFVYNDDFAQGKAEFEAQSGLFDEEGRRMADPMVQNTESNGRFHTDWLNMIYPRLKVAKDLLADDGVIFISIDDNEVENLRKVCDEVLGEKKFLAQVVPISNPGGRDYKQIAIMHEYLLIYGKSEDAVLYELEKDADFSLKDAKGGYELRELRNRNPKFHRGNRPNLFYPFYVNPNLVDDNGCCAISLVETDDYTIAVCPYNSVGVESVWRWGKPKSLNAITDSPFTSEIVARQKKDGGWNIYEKCRKSTSKAKSVWDETEMRTEDGTRLIRAIFGKTVFDHPKPLSLVHRCAQLCTLADDIVLDFFSGSAATAHAVMQLNAEDGGNRKFIMVQLPELTDEKSEAYKAGYKNICEIGKERIRRAGKKVKEEAGLHAQNLDTGFRVLKLDESNMADVYYTPADTPIQTTLAFDALVDNIREGRTAEDLLFQVLPECNLPLSSKIETREIHGKKVFVVNDGYLMACFDKDINEAVITAIAKEKPYYFVMCDRSIASDSVADNFDQIFNAYSKETVRRIL